MKHKIIILLMCLLFAAGTISVSAASAEDNTADRVTDLIGGIADFLEETSGTSSYQTLVDDFISTMAGSGAEWYAITLKQYHQDLDFSVYIEALKKHVYEEGVHTVTEGELAALSFIFMDHKEEDFVHEAVDSSVGEYGLMSWIYGLHLLNNGALSDNYKTGDVIHTLLSLRKDDGGWSLMGDYSDIDVTAMTIQALAPHYKTDVEVHEAVDGALTWLSGKQLDNAGYQSFGNENPESLAQVIVALTSLGIDPEEDERFIKNGHTVIDALSEFRLEDGSFRHVMTGPMNMTATTQSFYSLVSIWRVRNGYGPLYVYDPDEFKTEPGSSEQEATSEESSGSSEEESTEPSSTVEPSGSSEEKTETEETVTKEASKDPTIPSSAAPAPGNKSGKKPGYKLWACLAVAALMLISILIQILRKKRRFKNYLSIFIIGGVAIALILLTNFEKTGNYYSRTAATKENAIGTVTLTIRCDTIVGKDDNPYVPSDGVILPVTTFYIEEGETVFDLLTEAARTYNIQMENKGSVFSAHGQTFIAGINYLYDHDYGELSGWVYHVNGISASVGCGDYVLQDGDSVAWHYTCNLGEDVQ